MSKDIYALKIATEKVKLIADTLAKLDEGIALISAFTMDADKQALVTGIVNNIEDIKTVVSSADEMNTIVADILKGNYLGNRKIDIALSSNQSDSASAVSYKQVDVILTNGTKLSMPFLSGEAILELTSHADIKSYMTTHALWAQVQYTECTVEEAVGTTPTLIRLRDADGHSSNVERVELTVHSGVAIEQKPSYFWAKSTSALQTIANRVGDIIALGNDIDKIVSLSQNIDELSELQSSLTGLKSLYTNITELLKSSEYAQTASTKASEASASAQTASLKAGEASSSATSAAQSAQVAANKANEIKGITTQAQTGTAGSQVQVSYNPVDGKFSFVIPKGDKGDRGEAFKVNAMGLFAVRTTYDTQPKDFSFFALDTSMIYFKNSDTTADWSTGVPFGKGDKGDKGDAGNGIATIAKISGDGSSGTTDVYRITMTNNNTFDFSVKNGRDSDVDKAYVDNAIATLSQLMSQALANKADKTATEQALNGKADKATTLSGYGITNAYTKSEVDTLNTEINSSIDALKDVAQNTKNAAYTLALTDRGKSIDVITGGITITVPLNSAVAFPIGATVTITNLAATAITIGASATLRQAGTTNTGNRTLAVYGMATLRKVAVDIWLISGAGLS